VLYFKNNPDKLLLSPTYLHQTTLINIHLIQVITPSKCINNLQ